MWILIKLGTLPPTTPPHPGQQNNCLWGNGSETTLDFMARIIFTGLATELHPPVALPTADASFSHLSKKAVTHKQEQISLACRKGKLLAEINLQMLEIHRKELVGGEGLISCPIPRPLPPPSVHFLFPAKPSWVLLGPCWA